MTPRMQIALDSWDQVPDWVQALVKGCDEPGASQNQAAKRLGFSASVVSQVIRNDYRGNMRNLEYRVRAVFMPDTVHCPGCGPIQSSDCLAWQDKAREARSSASPVIVRMRKQCLRCPRFIEASAL